MAWEQFGIFGRSQRAALKHRVQSLLTCYNNSPALLYTQPDLILLTFYLCGVVDIAQPFYFVDFVCKIVGRTTFEMFVRVLGRFDSEMAKTKIVFELFEHKTHKNTQNATNIFMIFILHSI